LIIKILLIAIVTIISSSLVKSLKSEFSLLINICGGIIIFLIASSELAKIIDSLNFIGNISGVSSSIIISLVKVVGVGYITEFCADIAEDSGNKFLATKVILGGKIAICIMALPIIKYLFQTIISLI